MTTITRTAPVESTFRGGIDVRVSLRDGAGDGVYSQSRLASAAAHDGQ